MPGQLVSWSLSLSRTADVAPAAAEVDRLRWLEERKGGLEEAWSGGGRDLSTTLLLRDVMGGGGPAGIRPVAPGLPRLLVL